MPQQYAASDARTGLNVTITGEFPDDPEDRVRIARTSNLFTRLMSTILATESTAERRERFRAIETQLEIVEALIRGDMREVQRLIRETLHTMGVTEEQLREVEQQLREQLERLAEEHGGSAADFGALGQLFGAPPDEDDEQDDRPLDDRL